MNKKIDLTNLLKDCPKGMPLDCAMFDDVTFIGVEKTPKPISIRAGEIYYYLTEFGTWSSDENAKCVIFPKGKTTWDEFQRPFKDGDILYIDCNDDEDTYKQFQYIFILKEISNGKIYCYCYIDKVNINKRFEICWLANMTTYTPRFATEEEKEKLFQYIKDNGYKWNAETKTLEKLIVPKFKIGDKVVKKGGINIPVLITEVSGENYYSNTENSVGFFKIKEQDNWELVPNKFDITTLKPFDRVLVRRADDTIWCISHFSHMNNGLGLRFVCEDKTSYSRCVPYNEETKYLVGTTEQAPDKYINW